MQDTRNESPAGGFLLVDEELGFEYGPTSLAELEEFLDHLEQLSQ